jgi:peptidoglycan hydrolase-like protein with peptidoglycan-binding domain
MWGNASPARARSIALAPALALALGFATAGPALPQAQPPAASASKVDPAQIAAARVFEALDSAERRAIQRDLVWAAQFTGAPTGEFGPLTFAAIKRFEAEAKFPPDGILTPEERKLLARFADAGREAFGFVLETDPVSKMRIGIPMRILPKRSTGPAGLSRWQDPGESATVDLSLGKPEDKLETLFERGTAANVAGRKITYKLLRPDFFVISGETQDGKFYRRLEKGADGTLRGFSIGYDKRLSPKFDRLVIAMASTFEAVPSAAPMAVASAPAAPAAVARSAAPEPKRVTAVEIAAGRFVTAASVAACKALTLGNVPATVEKRGDSLALIALTREGGRPLPLAAATGGEAILLQRNRAGALHTANALLAAGRAQMPLQAGGAGAALVDRSGQLAGLVIEEPRLVTQVAGVVPATRYRFVDAAGIASFAGVMPAAPSAPRAMSAVAAEATRSIVSLTCAE